MHIELKQPYLSIKKMNGFDLPDFAVLIGRNGVGKTQLLDAIMKGSASVSDLPISEIEKYDINTFQPRNSGLFGWRKLRFRRKNCRTILFNEIRPCSGGHCRKDLCGHRNKFPTRGTI